MAIIFLPRGYGKVIALICATSAIFFPFIYSEYAATTFGFTPDQAHTIMFIVFLGAIAIGSSIRLQWNKMQNSRSTKTDNIIEQSTFLSWSDICLYSLLAVLLSAFFIYFPFFGPQRGKLPLPPLFSLENAYTIIFFVLPGAVLPTLLKIQQRTKINNSGATETVKIAKPNTLWPRSDIVFYCLLSVLMPAFFIYFPFFARLPGKLVFLTLGGITLAFLLIFVALKMLQSRYDWRFARRAAGTAALAIAMLSVFSMGSGLWVQHKLHAEVRNEAYELLGNDDGLKRFWNLTILTMRSFHPGIVLNYSSDPNAKLIIKTTPEYRIRYWSWAHMRFIDISEVTFDERC